MFLNIHYRRWKSRYFPSYFVCVYSHVFVNTVSLNFQDPLGWEEIDVTFGLDCVPWDVYTKRSTGKTHTRLVAGGGVSGVKREQRK